MDREVRVRFAPSPTGALHIGGVRTALYNYLFAKQNNGTFIIRIEDTDQTRFVKGAEDYIFETLQWLGLKSDESPLSGGPYAPYRQSERKSNYMQYALRLIESGHAYYAFDTAEELEEMRNRLKEAKSKNPTYNAISRGQMRNSLTLPADEVKSLLENNTPYVIRIKVPMKEEIRLNDMIRGWTMWHSSVLDDKVLIKSDGMPTYHLANVVDDYLMKISHVIRGEEWLPSAPLHILLYQFLGWEKVMPSFAHLPLILNPDGEGKLSKRKSKEYGFPVFPLDWTDPESGEKSEGFRESNYLPEALINFLALLGWNPGSEQEIFSMDELISTFSFERVNKAGAKFDIEKAKWFNQQYLRGKSDSELSNLLLEDMKKNGIDTSSVSLEKANKIVNLMKERADFVGDLWKGISFLFGELNEWDENTLNKKWDENSPVFVEELKQELQNYQGVWEAENIKHLMHDLIEKKELKMGKVMPAVRLVITGVGFGPDLAAMMEILGKDETLHRIDKSLKMIAEKK